MAELSGAELKCYLAILRKTKGWNKDFDAVSVTQLMSVTGLSNRAVIDACNHLVELNLLYQKTGSRGVKIFSVNLCNNFTSEKSSPVTSEKSSHTKNNIKNTTQNTNKKTTQKKFARFAC
ncbi:phage replication protein O, N-terminal domain [Haemophilus influenzae]|nr:phage replication protein O, N-terminal domain [Haemophilus influenzae]AVJ02037.1 phage replication protein O, N-terminal domain [Haemophilus influenzae]